MVLTGLLGAKPWVPDPAANSPPPTPMPGRPHVVSKKCQTNATDAFDSPSRYSVALLNTYSKYFDRIIVQQSYPTEFQLNIKS